MLCTKKMRSLIVILALFFLIGVISACSNEHTTLKLSEMDEDIFIQHLTDYGVEIPDNLEVTAVQDIIADLEVEPDKSAPIVGWTEYADFFEELRNVVKSYNNLIP